MKIKNQSDTDLFVMDNLSPKTTGLPMTIWVSSYSNNKHGFHIKVSKDHDNQIDINNTMVVEILRPYLYLIDGNFISVDENLIYKWISINYDVLLNYWNGDIDTADLLSNLKPLESLNND